MTSTLIAPNEMLDDAEFGLETNPMRAMLTRYERAAADRSRRAGAIHISLDQARKMGAGGRRRRATLSNGHWSRPSATPTL